MSSKTSKKELAVSELSEVDESQIPDEPVLMKELKMLKEEELPLDYNYSGSDISDPLEEEHKPKIEEDLKKARKKLRKLDISLQLMNSFSEEFKKSMADVRKEMKVSYYI